MLSARTTDSAAVSETDPTEAREPAPPAERVLLSRTVNASYARRTPTSPITSVSIVNVVLVEQRVVSQGQGSALASLTLLGNCVIPASTSITVRHVSPAPAPPTPSRQCVTKREELVLALITSLGDSANYALTTTSEMIVETVIVIPIILSRERVTRKLGDARANLDYSTRSPARVRLVRITIV